MVRLARIAGSAVMAGALAFAVFYVLWFFGLTPLDPQLAVKLPVLALVLAICFIAGWLGYVMATAATKLEDRARGESR